MGGHELDYLPDSFSKDLTDSKIIAMSLKIKNENILMKVTLITKDMNVHIKAGVFALEAEDYVKDRLIQ